MSRISEVIKRLRAMPMSQSQIARITGIPQARISRWESGKAAMRSADSALVLYELLLKKEEQAARKQGAATPPSTPATKEAAHG